MLTLGFETANFGASIALVKDNKELGSKIFNQSYGQAGFLVPELHQLVRENGYSLQDIDLFATTTGPGSFTGVRLGLSLARTLKLASHAPVLGIPSPFWVAHSFLKNHPSNALPLLICLEARRDDLYCQLFSASGVPVQDCINCLPENLESYFSGPCLAIGNGIEHLKKSDQKNNSKNIFQIKDFQPLPRSLCFLAQDLFIKGQENNFPLNPLYIRDPDISTPKKLPL